MMTMPKITSAKELIGLTFPVRNDIVPGIIPTGMSLLVSKPKSGKTWLSLGISLAISSGNKALGSIDVIRGDVLYLALEDSQEKIQGRLAAMLGNIPPPEGLDFAWSWPSVDCGGIEALEFWIKTRENPALIVVDTIKKVRPETKQGKTLYDLDYEAISPLTELSHQYHTSIIGNHHDRKMDADDILDVVSGSHGLTGACDTILVLRRTRSQASAILYVVAREMEECEKALSWTMPNWTLMGDASDHRLSTERKEIKELIEKVGIPISPKDVAAMMGKTYNNVKYLMWSMSHNGDLRVEDGKYTVNNLKESILAIGHSSTLHIKDNH